MYKKLLTAFMVLTASVAFATAPAAFAKNTPLVTVPTGTTPTPTHSSPTPITMTNVGSIVFTSSVGNVECQTGVLTGDLIKNVKGQVEAEITTADVRNHESIECLGAGGTAVTMNPTGGAGLPWCLRSTEAMATDEFQIRGGGCTQASRPITFTRHPTALGAPCYYVRNNPIPGTYTTHPEGTVLSISEVEFTREAGSSFFCPATRLVDMKFALTSNGNTIYIDK